MYVVFWQLPATWNIRLKRLDKGYGFNDILMAHMAYIMHLFTVGLQILIRCGPELEDTVLLTKLIEGDTVATWSLVNV